MILPYEEIHRLAPNAKKTINIYLDNKCLVKEKYDNKRILLIACSPNNTWLTIGQTIYELAEHSQFEVEILNTNDSGIPEIPGASERYFAVIVHNTACYAPDNLEKICERIISNFRGIKILMKQDEFYRTDCFSRIVKRFKFDLVLTLWDEATAKRIYVDAAVNPNTEVMQYLTGYIPDSYSKCKYPIENREIDVGYRGSIQPIQFGMLAFEKKNIGDRFLQFAKKYNLKCDISSRWEDRFSGTEWLDFLGNCKSCLGVESGSDIVDIDGKVEEVYQDFYKDNLEAKDEEVLALLSPFEKRLQYRVISPRHFEAAACRTLQIMYEGDYQHIFVPYRHFVPLKRDFSNIDEVIEILNDNKKRQEIADCAFEEIVLNEKYSFRTFVKQVDNKILHILER